MNSTRQSFGWYLLLIITLLIGTLTWAGEPLVRPAFTEFTAEQADRMHKAATTTLAPVYPYLAEHIVDTFQLANKSGIGLDIGGGPGRLVFELCQRTSGYYWINADVNTYHAEPFFREALSNGCASRVALIFADVQHLPFRDDYADLIVSRGSFPFWENQERGFAEIYRVLKPGGQALIGRGFPPNLPFEIAKQIRKNQSKSMPKYDAQETVDELRALLKRLRISDHEIIRPRSGQSEINYGVWVRFSKPQ